MRAVCHAPACLQPSMIVSLSLSLDVVQIMDELVGTGDYAGRSQLVRAALRDFLNLQKAVQEIRGRVGAVVVLQYPEAIEPRLSEIRHAHNDLVKNMLQTHARQARCTTILQCAGPDHKMRRLLAQLRGMDKLDSIHVTLEAPTESVDEPAPRRTRSKDVVSRRSQNS